MDPFNAVVEPGGILKYTLVTHARIDFPLYLPELKQWRRDGQAIEVRMVMVNSNKVCHAWPTSLQFLANSNEVFCIKPPEEGHKRRDVPQNVSAGLKHGMNQVSIRMTDNRIQDFVLSVVLTCPRSIPDLCLKVPECREEAGRARICKVIANQQSPRDGDEDIVCLTSDKMRLRCPITMERIEEPVRGRECQHLQCFGLQVYLASNRQMSAFNNRWVCPVCSLVLRPPDLERDTYVARILAETPEDIDEVNVAWDGSWRCPAPLPDHLPAAASPSTRLLDLDSMTAVSLSPSRGRSPHMPSPRRKQSQARSNEQAMPVDVEANMNMTENEQLEVVDQVEMGMISSTRSRKKVGVGEAGQGGPRQLRSAASDEPENVDVIIRPEPDKHHRPPPFDESGTSKRQCTISPASPQRLQDEGFLPSRGRSPPKAHGGATAVRGAAVAVRPRVAASSPVAVACTSGLTNSFRGAVRPPFPPAGLSSHPIDLDDISDMD